MCIRDRAASGKSRAPAILQAMPALAPQQQSFPDGRAAAWWVLEAINAGEVDRVGDALSSRTLDEREGALARELALGVIRHQRLYDHLAATFRCV